MRCPDCNKFCSLDSDQDPEVNIDVSTEGVTGDVRIANACAECGTELTETTFDINETHEELAKHEGEGHDLEVEEETERDVRTEGKGRGLRTFYQVRVHYTVRCSCKKDEPIVEGDFEDEVQASAMDEMN